jgi:hypothetical protein
MNSSTRMTANPGGSLAPEAVVGRETLIEQIWRRLSLQCVLLHAERRIGKTSVIRKMVAEPPEGWFGVYQDLEDVHSAAEFASAVHDRVQEFLGRGKRTANAARKIYEEHDFGNLSKKKDRPWKNLLVTSIEDLIAAKAEQRMVMFWDEVPYMVANICKADGELTAAEVLDTLRMLRQKYPDDLRMLFTGSIGLHHVLSSLHDAQIATEPVNDMFAIEVTPLSPASARELARSLISGENLATRDADEAAEAIAEETDCFPFYIQHVVSSLSFDQLPANPNQIQELVQRQLVDAGDPWELGHFRSRIRIYYANIADARLVELILDSLCDQDVTTVNDLLNLINAQTGDFDDRGNLVRVLRLMERDHYVTRDTEGRYRFRFPLIRRWWKLDRGL